MSGNSSGGRERWTPGDHISTVDGISCVGTWRSYDTDVCTKCDIEFDDDHGYGTRNSELQEHIDAEHPRACRCNQIAAYAIGAGYTYGALCAECAYELAEDDPPPFTAWYRLSNEANADAPLLPEDHPVEVALSGLYDSDGQELVTDGGTVEDGSERFVRLEESHAEALLEAAGVLRDDIASGKSYGFDEENHAENVADLEVAYQALRTALDEGGPGESPVDETDRREAFAYRPGGRKLSAFPYPGGKTTYCDEIISRLPEHRRYVEPFGGSAAVLLNKPTSYIEVYNDLDEDVVHFFEVLREGREELQEWLYRTPFSRSLYEEAVAEFYDGHRPTDDVERAGKWFYLRYSQYNGSLDRRNGFKTGGKRNEARSFRGSIHALEAIADRFAEVTLEAEPYEEVIDRYDAPNTVLYCDPPYYNTRSDRPHYRVGQDFDHDRFVNALRDRDGKWIVSYGELPPGLEDVAETVATYTAMYSMSYDEQRQERTEHLAMNFDPRDETSFSPVGQKTLVTATNGGKPCDLHTESDR